MAKEDLIEPGAEDIAELDAIAQGSIPNRNELVSLKNGTTISRDQVYKYASVMSSNFLIAELLGIDANTLKDLFKRELKMGRAFARQKLMVRFYNLALYGNNPADRIFALKNWTAMSDQGLKEELEDVEEGAQFKIRRPQKILETVGKVEQRNEVHDEYNSVNNEHVPKQSEKVNETD